MKTTLLRKMIAVLLAVLSIVGVFVNAPTVSAASYSALSHITPNKYCKAYPLNTSGITIPYRNSSLTERGTITYGKSNTAYIDNATDELWILQVDVNGKWAKVSYPCGSKRAEAYIALNAITSANASGTAKTSTGKFYCAPRFGSSTSSKYFVSKGEITYLISTNGNEYQILYPNNSGWRLGICSKSDYEIHCGKISKDNKPNDASANTTYKTFKLEFNDIQSWQKALEVAERSAVFGGSYVQKLDGNTYYTGNVITGITVMSWKTIKVKIPLVGPGDYYEWRNVSFPSEVRFKLHKHDYKTQMWFDVSTLRFWQTCECGLHVEWTWEVPWPDLNDDLAQNTHKTIDAIKPVYNKWR